MKDQGEEPGVRCQNVLPDCQSNRGAILCGAASDDEVLNRHMSQARRLLCTSREAQLREGEVRAHEAPDVGVHRGRKSETVET